MVNKSRPSSVGMVMRKVENTPNERPVARELNSSDIHFTHRLTRRKRKALVIINPAIIVAVAISSSIPISRS